MVMEWTKRAAALSLIAALALSSSCGKDSNSAKVQLEILPANPIVIPSDLETTINGEETTISAPWFLATFRVVNKSEKVVSILAIKMFETGSLDGASVQEEKTYTPVDETLNGIFISVRPGQTEDFTAYYGGHVKTTGAIFNVRANFIGWFSDAAEFPVVTGANERFEKTISFGAK